MQFTKLTFKGLVPFPDLQTVEFPAAPLVAVTGENGAGKTTFLDLIPLALYGTAPNRKGFYEMFRGTDALVDLEFGMNGQAYRIKRLINANSRTQKPYLYQNGIPMTEGKVAEFEELMAMHLGISESAFMASVYHAQSGKGNPLSMNDGERRQLLNEVLGLWRFEHPFQVVSDEAARVDREIEALAAQRKILQQGMADQNPQALAESIGALDREIESLKGEIAAKETELETARQDLANAKANAQNLDELKRQIGVFEQQIRADEMRMEELQGQVKKNQDQLIAQRDQIEFAVGAIAQHEAEIQAHSEQRDTLTAQASAQDAAHTESLKGRIQSVKSMKDRFHELEREYYEVKRKRQELDATKLTLETTIKTLTPSVEVLGQVPCNETEFPAVCPLLKNAQGARLNIDDKQRSLAELETQIAALNPDDSTVKALWEEIKSEEALLNTSLTQKPGDESRAAAQVIEAKIRCGQAEIQKLKPLADLMPYLKDVDARIGQYQAEIAQVEIRLTSNRAAAQDTKAKLQAAMDLNVTLAQTEDKVAKLSATRNGLNALMDEYTNKAGYFRASLETLMENERKVDALTVQGQGLAILLTDLNLLKEALGPKGARALKIDAAGPEISELVNALLRECYGQKFTIAIKTLRNLTSDETQTRECLQFSIIDNATGEETIVENKSGGEQALIKEVISMGLAIYQRRRAGVDTRTLIRDEATAPLSENNTVLYIRMMKKAMEIGGFDQVYYVSHKSAAQQLADAVIEIGGGKVTVAA